MQAMLKSKIALVALCIWCLVLLGVRVRYADSAHYDFMAWNLWLAVIPMLAAALLRLFAARSGAALLKVSLFVTWLAFLPNAPYMITDLIHLTSRPPVPLWYDVVLLGSFAATGVLLAYVSVADIEAVSSARFGRVFGSVLASGSLAICGFGIYLGRFLRWNSWDLLTSPASLFAQIAHRFTDPMAHTRTWAVTALYGTALVLGYVALRATAVSLAPVEPRRATRPDRRIERRVRR